MIFISDITYEVLYIRRNAICCYLEHPRRRYLAHQAGNLQNLLFIVKIVYYISDAI